MEWQLEGGHPIELPNIITSMLLPLHLKCAFCPARAMTLSILPRHAQSIDHNAGSKHSHRGCLTVELLDRLLELSDSDQLATLRLLQADGLSASSIERISNVRRPGPRFA